MPHILGHTPPPPPGTSNGLPPTSFPGQGSAPTTGVLTLANPSQSNPARKGVSLLIGALVGGVVGFLVMGPIGGVVGAALGAGAVLLLNRRRDGG